MNEHIHHEPMEPGTSQPTYGTGTHKTGAQGASERAKETVRESTDKLRAKAEEMKTKASELGAQAKERGREYVEGQKHRAADKIEGYSDTIRETSERLEREQDPNIAHYTRLMADKLEQAADYVRNCDFRDLRQDAETMARRHPAVFFGGMFLAGLAVARFVKASAEERSDHDDDYQDEYDEPQYSQPSHTEGEISTEETYASHPSPVI